MKYHSKLSPHFHDLGIYTRYLVELYKLGIPEEHPKQPNTPMHSYREACIHFTKEEKERALNREIKRLKCTAKAKERFKKEGNNKRLIRIGKKAWSQRCKPIIQLTLDDKVVRYWPSAKEAELTLGFKSKGCITQACRGIYKSSCGFKWRYRNEEEYQEKEEKKDTLQEIANLIHNKRYKRFEDLCKEYGITGYTFKQEHNRVHSRYLYELYLNMLDDEQPLTKRTFLKRLRDKGLLIPSRYIGYPYFAQYLQWSGWSNHPTQDPKNTTPTTKN